MNEGFPTITLTTPGTAYIDLTPSQPYFPVENFSGSQYLKLVTNLEWLCVGRREGGGDPT